MGGAPAVLGGRAAAAVGLLAAVTAYYLGHDELPALPADGDVLFLGLVLIPALFALPLLALPLRTHDVLLPIGALLAALGFIFDQGEFELGSTLFKLAGMTCLGFWFLGMFESLWWAVTVALIVPAVDAYSVWRGPTKHIVEEREEVFLTLSIGFPVWGPGGTANLGLPDLLFFAVFLAAAARWGLRVRLTWLLMALSFGATLGVAVWTDADGWPALPLLCLGFLAPNADLIWRRRRIRSAA